jgi:hypothetical protein
MDSDSGRITPKFLGGTALSSSQLDRDAPMFSLHEEHSSSRGDLEDRCDEPDEIDGQIEIPVKSKVEGQILGPKPIVLAGRCEERESDLAPRSPSDWSPPHRF